MARLPHRAVFAALLARIARAAPAPRSLPTLGGPLDEAALVVAPDDHELWCWRPEGLRALVIDAGQVPPGSVGDILGCYLRMHDRNGAEFLLWHPYPQAGDVIATARVTVNGKDAHHTRPVSLAFRAD